jgi:hypothetical protein
LYTTPDVVGGDEIEGAGAVDEIAECETHPDMMRIAPIKNTMALFFITSSIIENGHD